MLWVYSVTGTCPAFITPFVSGSEDLNRASETHHAAFDRNLFTVDSDYRLQILNWRLKAISSRERSLTVTANASQNSVSVSTKTDWRSTTPRWRGYPGDADTLYWPR